MIGSWKAGKRLLKPVSLTTNVSWRNCSYCPFWWRKVRWLRHGFTLSGESVSSSRKNGKTVKKSPKRTTSCSTCSKTSDPFIITIVYRTINKLSPNNSKKENKGRDLWEKSLRISYLCFILIVDVFFWIPKYLPYNSYKVFQNRRFLAAWSDILMLGWSWLKIYALHKGYLVVLRQMPPTLINLFRYRLTRIR